MNAEGFQVIWKVSRKERASELHTEFQTGGLLEVKMVRMYAKPNPCHFL